ncbi:hypothetical protein PULV_b0053 [Pseudoalteromonas ulvae UL12]|uniref:Lipoprotein n=1 Tax=Pseudoalteromonas ulvae TaxID=107327 RepID=A0A244CQZ1_PSEDV|nr:DUF6491 family protein [Pseudoalteromonas ulvae]MBE0365476.1 hypothetical protein [Pseudoalteromonas ulvae UL12]OUL58022.1 hypothetical protein B1199_06595 [Pseudoalteromonas ulvae]
MKNLLTVTLISVSLLGCASTTMSSKERNTSYAQYVKGENLSSKDKITSFKYDGWKSLSDNYLIITTIQKDDYLIETKGKCVNLNDSISIKLNRSSNSSLDKFGDTITPISSSTEDYITTNCHIKSIYPISDKQVDYLVNIGQSVQKQS